MNKYKEVSRLLLCQCSKLIGTAVHVINAYSSVILKISAKGCAVYLSLFPWQPFRNILLSQPFNAAHWLSHTDNIEKFRKVQGTRPGLLGPTRTRPYPVIL